MEHNDLEVLVDVLESIEQRLKALVEQEKRVADVLEAIDKHGIIAYPSA